VYVEVEAYFDTVKEKPKSLNKGKKIHHSGLKTGRRW